MLFSINKFKVFNRLKTVFVPNSAKSGRVLTSSFFENLLWTYDRDVCLHVLQKQRTQNRAQRIFKTDQMMEIAGCKGNWKILTLPGSFELPVTAFLNKTDWFASDCQFSTCQPKIEQQNFIDNISFWSSTKSSLTLDRNG